MPVRSTVAHSVALVATRVAVTAATRLAGFSALSDDDYCRVTIAQAFALHPRLDPSGTSWLPAPFWGQGAIMLLAGRSLRVAELTSWTVACLAVLIAYGAARWAGSSPRASFVGALSLALLPVAAVTGAATVPELPVAACVAAALILLRRADAPRMFAAAGLLTIASLSRYEAWPAALAVAVSFLWPSAERASLRVRLGASAAALSGPALWIAWNAHAHGDPLHFLARVSAYRDALGVASSLGAYPIAIALDVIPVAIVAVGAVALGARKSPWGRAVAAAAFVLVALVAAEMRGGAPTHHPERAVLSIAIVAWFAAIDALDRQSPQRAWLIGAAAILALVSGLRVHGTLPGYGVDRSEEVAVGGWLATHAQPGDRVLVEPSDYGYFAIQAASGRPEAITVTRSLDPRNRGEQPVVVEARWVVSKSGEGDVRIGAWGIARR